MVSIMRPAKICIVVSVLALGFSTVFPSAAAVAAQFDKDGHKSQVIEPTGTIADMTPLDPGELK